MQIHITRDWRVPTAFWWIVAACLLAYSWQHLAAQTVPAQSPQATVANAPDVNGLLTRIDQTSQRASQDINRLRIDKWKADSSDKQQAQADADSVQRNMTAALPGMIAAMKASPQDFAAAFKLYRNMNALYDVMKTLTQASAAFGAKQDYQSLSQDADAIDGYRRNLADYMESLAASKDAELNRLRLQAKTAQTATVPPKRVIIDDNAPTTKKTAKKKTAKPAAPATNPQ